MLNLNVEFPTRFTNPSAIIALGLTLFTISSQQLSANNPPGSGGDCDKKYACKDCNDKPTGEYAKTADDCPGSFNLSIGVGQASIERAGNFLNYSRAGTTEGQVGRGYYRNFDEVRETILNSGNISSKAAQNITIIHPRIDSAVYSPKIFDYAALSGTEYIENENGLKQALTDTAFTDIEKTQDGFIVRVWDRNELTSLTKVGNFYTAPAVEKALTTTVFKNPDYPQENNRLEVTFKQNLSGSSEHAVTKLYDHQDPNSYVVTTYEGEQATGNPLERLTLTYVEIGARPWDYTYERKLERAPLINGTVNSNLEVIMLNREVYKDASLSAQGGDINGKRLLSKTEAFGTAEAQTTIYDYYEEPTNANKHGRLKSQQNPDGSWEYWDYQDDGGNTVVETKYSSWKDVAFTNYLNGLKQETLINSNEATRVTSVAGVEISKEKYTTSVDTESGRLLSEVQQWNGAEWSKTATCFEAPDANSAADGRPICTILPDGTAITYEYSESNGQTTVTERKGAVSNDISGGEFPVVSKGTKKVTLYNEAFAKVSEEISDIESSLVLSTELATEFDVSGRPTKVVYNSNPDDYIIQQYGCCGLEYSRDRSGKTTTYYRDALKRVYRTVTQRSSTGEPITTSTDFDGLTTKVTRSSVDGTLLVSETTQSLGGLTISAKLPDADGDGIPETSTRTIVYSATTGSTTTNVAPDGGSTITATFLDGKTKDVSGTAVTGSDTATITYDYGLHGLNGGGTYTLTTQANGTQSHKSFRDQLGRTFRTENADGSYTETSYYPQTAAAGSRGKVETVKDADETALAGSGSHVNYSYNGRGERVSTITKLSNNQQMVTTTEHDDVSDPDIGVSHRYRTWINGVLTNTSLRSGDGYKAKNVTLSGTSTAVRSVAIDGAWNETSTTADGVFSIQTYSDGLIKEVATYAAGTDPAVAGSHLTLNTQAHDAFGRALTTTDSRTGTVSYNGYNENGSVKGMTDAGGRTTAYTYDKMSRTTVVDDPDTIDKDGGTLANITRTTYYPTGELLAVWGDQTYSRMHIYDAQSRLIELRTYQDLAHGTEPTVATTGFTSTKWNYNPQRGWLDNKRYDDDKGTDYTYTGAGRLKTRTWARGIVTTYSYDQGQMVGTDYSDATQDVIYAYDNFGRPSLVTQGSGSTQNQHAYIYDPATLALDKETVSYASGLSRTLDRSQDALLRPSGFQLMNGTTEEHATSYGYDSAGRLAGVHTGATYPTNPAAADFTYDYLAKSVNLLEAVSGPAHTVTNTYETNRDVLDVKTNATASSTISAFDYSVNALGQRDDVNRSGSAFTTANTETWKYNAKGEVVTAAHSTNNAFDRAYQFDGIGNRKKSADSLTLPSTDNYTTNALNQLTTANGATRVHDADGNLTDNETHLYIWDAENRLIEVKLKSNDSTVAAYAYDYLSRRITKTIVAAVTNFVYDDWNPIAEFSGSTLDKSYTWGLDLSGSIQGTGGVGGLLLVNDGSADYYPTYDGNGNVSEYVDANGTTVAHYEYDAFGQVVASGAKANDFTHQFSTKQIDTESGLYYYGYRYYDASNGRWLSRDPLGEGGGFNIYAFVLNDSLSSIDILGLSGWDTACEIADKPGSSLGGSLSMPLGPVTVSVKLNSTRKDKSGRFKIDLTVRVSKSIWDFVPGFKFQKLRSLLNVEAGISGTGSLKCCYSKAVGGSFTIGVSGGGSFGGAGPFAGDRRGHRPKYTLPGEKQRNPQKGLYAWVELSGDVSWDIPGDFTPDDGGIYLSGEFGYRWRFGSGTFWKERKRKLWPN